MHLESTRFSPSPESQTFSKHTLVRKSRTSAKVLFTCHGQVIPSFFKSRKRHDKPPRFGGAVSVFVCAVGVLVCAVRVLVCTVSILFVLWAIWFWCDAFVVVAINLLLLWVICCCCDSCGPLYHTTESILHMYCCYPHSIEGINPQYWIPSTVLMLSPQCWCYPPLYWATSTVLKLSRTVPMLFPRCTEQPPMYWTTLHCTEPTSYGVNAAQIERESRGSKWVGRVEK